MKKERSQAFTLIELLVVIGIMSVLAAILFPVFSNAKIAAKKTQNLSNLKQLGLGVQLYVADHENYPMMSSSAQMTPRMRWPDYIFVYVRSTDMFRGPLASADMFGKFFAHDVSKRYGGYGYNYQYLGNSRSVAGNPNFPFTANESQIPVTSETIAISDTQGVRRSPGIVSGGDYVIDPPLPSLRGSGLLTGYYANVADCAPHNPGSTFFNGCRSLPAEWTFGRVTVGWCDGHATAIPRRKLDDFNGDGAADNGFWNGQADSTVR